MKNKEGILMVAIIVAAVVSYFIFKTPIWVSSLIITSGLLFFVANAFRK